MQLLFHRYICSSGEKESKSVISLFDDFLSGWVCVTLSFVDKFFYFVALCLQWPCRKLLRLCAISNIFWDVHFSPFIMMFSPSPENNSISRIRSIQEYPHHDYLL